MQFKNLFALITLAAAVSAAPYAQGSDFTQEKQLQGAAQGNSGQNSGISSGDAGKVGGDYTVEQAVTTCGNAQLNCCNRIEESGDETNAGLLANVLGGQGGVGIDCSPINVAAAIGVQVPITETCTAKAACCQNSGNGQNGLVNVGCVALPLL